MSKPIYWAIGAGVVLVIVWVIAREDEATRSTDAAVGVPAAKAEGDRASASASAKPVISAQQEAIAPVVGAGSPKPQSIDEDAHKIAVAQGFELLSKDANIMEDMDPLRPIVRRHEQLQDEPRDENWSERMEAALRSGIQDSLTAKSLDTQRVELPVVECRTTGCEVQALAYPEDNGKEGVDLQSILPTLVSDPLKGEFAGFPNMLMGDGSDGRTTVIVYLARKQK
jgi:hypothetical protein